MRWAETGRGKTQKSPHSNITTVQKRLNSQHHGQRVSDINREVPQQWLCPHSAFLRAVPTQHTPPQFPTARRSHPPDRGRAHFKAWVQPKSCWLGGGTDQDSSSCRSQLQPQVMLVTLLQWPDAMHEELRFQQASAQWIGSFSAKPRRGSCSPVLGGLSKHLCQKPTFC